MRIFMLAWTLCIGTFFMPALAPELQAASNYQENFDSGQAQGWSTFNGTWAVSSGVYGTATNVNPTISVYDGDTWATGFTYELRVYADWYASGNNVSAVFGHQSSTDFYEVQFNVQGVGETSGSVTVKRTNGSTVTIGSPAPVSGIFADTWFDAQITVTGSAVTVRVNDDIVIENLALPAAPAAGRIGLLSRNNVVRFDDVSVTLQNYSETFQSGSAQGWSTVGPWNVVNGYYANSDTSGLTLAFFQGSTWTSGFTYAARVYLDWSNTGNHGGVIFGYQDQQNFYEVLFNTRAPEETSGSVTINRIDAGTASTVATGTIANLPPDIWFETQVSLNGSDITVRVNGEAVASATLPEAPQTGHIGVIARSNQARFDDISVVAGTGGVLQFKSGFESPVALTAQSNPKFTGADPTAPAGKNDWDMVKTYLPWITKAEGYLEGGSLSIVNDPAGGANQVLRLRNTQNPVTSEAWSRSEFQLNQPGSWDFENGPNLFDRQFYRYRIYIPSAITTVVQPTVRSPWYMIWESHAWTFDDTRHGISLLKKANSSLWTFRIVQQDDPPNGPILRENTDQQTIAVPFDQWFTLEVYFRYHETNGRFYVAITRQGQPRQVIGNFVGQTKFGTKLHDQIIFKLYHSDSYIDALTETKQFYDDLEIWSDFPPGYNP